MVLYGRQRQHWNWSREASKVTSSSFLHSASFSSSPKPTEICKMEKKTKEKSATARNSRADFSIPSILPPFFLILPCPRLASDNEVSRFSFYLFLSRSRLFFCHYREAKGTEYTDYKLYKKKLHPAIKNYTNSGNISLVRTGDTRSCTGCSQTGYTRSGIGCSWTSNIKS
jgi:hypothetical protein